ncbi:hypothetical protein E4U54_005599 [Claviceps lovelessii]|nr:hypothetical protein E4U54_005599 [Claviceps lovelessii]
MKSTTILGALALPLLSAFASPVEEPSRVERAAIEGRAQNNLQYCCVLLQDLATYPSSKAFFVPWVAANQLTVYQANDQGNCRIYVHQTAKAPRDGGCADWTFSNLPCNGHDWAAQASVQGANFCQAPRASDAP